MNFNLVVAFQARYDCFEGLNYAALRLIWQQFLYRRRRWSRLTFLSHISIIAHHITSDLSNLLSEDDNLGGDHPE